MAGRGVDAYPIRIPESWAEARPWLERFIREQLSLADIRNAVEGPGIAISSDPGSVATISASSDIDALLQASLVTVTAASGLPNARHAIAGAGIEITDEGAGDGTVTFEVNDIPLSAFPAIQPLAVLGVPYDSADPERPLPIAASANDRLLTRVSDALAFTQLTGGMFPANVVEYAALASGVQASLDLADSALQAGDNVSALTNDAGYITGISAFSIGDLSDVSLGAPGSGEDGYSLVYDHDTTSFVLADVSGGGGGGGAEDFTDLDDVPSSYTGEGGKLVAVKAAEDGLEFVAGRNTVTSVSSSSGVVTLDYEDGDYFALTLTENVSSWVIDNPPASGKGFTLMVQITQDSTPRTVAKPGTTAGGAALDVSTGSGDIDLLAITSFDGGTTLRSTIAKDFS